MTSPRYKEDLKRVNEELKEEVERLEKIVCERYQPIFDIVTKRVQKLMQSQGIFRIELSPTGSPGKLYFSREGNFEFGCPGNTIDLQTVAKRYQIEHMRTQKAISRSLNSVQDALKMALDDLVDKSKEAYLDLF